ncbi:MAG TPA: LPS export ABC transporter periplasmic protein LptC [Caulobacteraceae bacterium]|jgi:lipopolysaccharide export system protein LptC|nr:LPS export ABC transporter periplasmic protein LptC [Caulobacteraceae bacterium]
MAAELTEGEGKARPALAAAAAQRRAAEMERWKRRSKRIGFYRRVLPWTMLAIVLAVAAWVGLRAFLSARQLDVTAATSAIHMTNPKFYGRDSKGRSFQLTATDAVRDVKDNNIVNLHAPGMMLDSGGKQPVKVAGGRGVYREDTKMLELVGGVLLQDGRGSAFRSAQASVDTRAGVVTGQKDVSGQGPLGRIAASSYAVHESGARVTFAGGVKTHIENR